MKLLCNSLLISLGILLPTSSVLAESPKPSESPALTASTSELVSVSDSSAIATDRISPTPDSEANKLPHVLREPLHAQKTVISTPIATQEAFPAKRTETVVVPVVTETRPKGTSVTVSQKNVKTILVPVTAPVVTPSALTDEVTQAPAQTKTPDQAPTTTVPTSQDSVTGTETPTQTKTPDKAPTTTPPSSENSTTGTQAPTQTEAPDKPPTTTPPSSEDSADAKKEPELSPEEIARQQKLIEADNLYMSGQIAAAEQLYREAKDPFKAQVQAKEKAPAIHDPAQLSPGGAVYWRMSEEGLAQKLQTKILVPLQFLVEQYPEFIPGHLRYAQALKDNGKPEEALQLLEQATTLYPAEPDLLKGKITALGEQQKWLEASLAARQFALLYPDNPQSKEFTTLADENLERYKRHVRRKLRGNAITNAITGALGLIFTGNLFGPISAVESTVMLLRGESAVGESVTKQVKRQLPMMEDEQVLNYVREVGNKLATATGRNDFQYEFNVIMDDDLNAFALPGGKVFVNAGAILKTNSEAELAGLLAHELSHAVLSHGFQLVTQGNLTANVTQFVPYGGLLGNLLILDYSRDMERQADALGTRILASSGYPADGMRNLMVMLDKQERDRPLFNWISTHPNTKERINNLETLIDRNGYNRYTYEGVARHLEIQKRVKELLRQYKERKERKEE
jgi:tetratricopeptide (TPR) repeat protein